MLGQEVAAVQVQPRVVALLPPPDRRVADDAPVAHHQDLVLGRLLQIGRGFGDLGRRREPFHNRMSIDPVPFSTPQPHRGHGAVVSVAAIRSEPEADRKILSWRAIRHDRMSRNCGQSRFQRSPSTSTPV